MSIIWTLIIGLVAGALAKFLMPGRDPGGFIITMLLGVAGAFVATWLGRAIGWYQEGRGRRVHRGRGRRCDPPDHLSDRNKPAEYRLIGSRAPLGGCGPCSGH